MMNLGGIHIRRRLLLTTFLPLVAALLVSWLLGVWLIAGRIEAQAQDTARNNLNTVRELYESEQGHIAEGLQLIGRSPELARAVDRRDSRELAKVLGLLSGSQKFSFITVLDRNGQVRYRAANPELYGDSLHHLKLVVDALNGRVSQATMLLSPLQVRQENPALVDQMLVPLRHTPRALPSNKVAEQRGLFMVAAAPVQDFKGNVTGVLLGGIMLNNNEALADRITRTLSREHDRKEQPGQAVTIFLDDVRIATTVTDSEGKRATGTRLSAEVAKRVLQEGKSWLDRAFVLKENYFAAYEPLRDPGGAVVGALYVGLPERPYVELRRNLNLTFLALLFGLSVLGLALTTRLGQMLTSRENEINQLNRTLEQKVVERTIQLEEKSVQLVEKEKELARSERLAELGMLSAGVAHEINNPLAIIRGNAELLQMSMLPEADEQEEVGEILTQVGRINRITSSLLNLARQKRLELSRFDLSELLDQILDQIGHQTPLGNCLIERAYAVNPIMIEGDREQLCQVFTNIVLNGLQAMNGAGRLALSTAPGAGGTCSITVADSGPGIAPDKQEHLFSPFFTTRKNGTGLGLAVSYGIVRNHGGSIEVHSAPGRGSEFVITLPVTAKG
jgi:two-component system, NtrC family, sensor kinase